MNAKENNLIVKDSKSISNYSLSQIINKVIHGDALEVLKKIPDEYKLLPEEPRKVSQQPYYNHSPCSPRSQPYLRWEVVMLLSPRAF